jgi:uncharacterized membrane protein
VSTDLVQRPELDQLLARVLQRGTWLGSTVIALGLALPIIGESGASSAIICTRIVTAGIALLIVLPLLRVFLMLIVFVCERDFRFSAIAMLVLAIIVLGSVLGVAYSPSGDAQSFEGRGFSPPRVTRSLWPLLCHHKQIFAAL